MKKIILAVDCITRKRTKLSRIFDYRKDNDLQEKLKSQI